MQRMHEPQDYLCSPRGPSRDILEDSEILRNESIITQSCKRRVTTLEVSAGGFCGVVRLSPPVLRSGLRGLRGSGDDPVE